MEFVSDQFLDLHRIPKRSVHLDIGHFLLDIGHSLAFSPADWNGQDWNIRMVYGIFRDASKQEV